MSIYKNKILNIWVNVLKQLFPKSRIRTNSDVLWMSSYLIIVMAIGAVILVIEKNSK